MQVARNLDFLPFGDSWYNGTSDKLQFTTYERDSESGNDYALARNYVWRLARFTALDPLSGSIGDPQSLNRYTYVQNDPIDLVDPSGSECNWVWTASGVQVICNAYDSYWDLWWDQNVLGIGKGQSPGGEPGDSGGGGGGTLLISPCLKRKRSKPFWTRTARPCLADSRMLSNLFSTVAITATFPDSGIRFRGRSLLGSGAGWSQTFRNQTRRRLSGTTGLHPAGSYSLTVISAPSRQASPPRLAR
jgi:RHS repeat-associated protein